MEIGRRGLLQVLAGAGLAFSGLGTLLRRVARAQNGPALALRAVTAADADALQAIMTACVNGPDAFFGKCGEWTLSWAQAFINACPHSIVLTQNGAAIAFFEIPQIGPPQEALSPDASAADQEKYALRERGRTTFRVKAAGIRYDLVPHADATRLFITAIYWAFRTAREMGYQHAEALAPWEQHPMMDHKWTDYPGCDLIQPVVRSQGDGHDVYWLSWQLDQAIAALATEDKFDVA